MVSATEQRQVLQVRASTLRSAVSWLAGHLKPVLLQGTAHCGPRDAHEATSTET